MRDPFHEVFSVRCDKTPFFNTAELKKRLARVSVNQKRNEGVLEQQQKVAALSEIEGSKNTDNRPRLTQQVSTVGDGNKAHQT